MPTFQNQQNHQHYQHQQQQKQQQLRFRQQHMIVNNPSRHRQVHNQQPLQIVNSRSTRNNLRAFAMPSSSTSTILPTTHSKSRQPQIRRSVVLLTIVLSVTFFVFIQLTPPSSSSSSTDFDSNDDALRYSDAAAHFRKSLTSEQLEEYYARREAALRARLPPSEDPRSIITTLNTTSTYFRACALSTETSTLHPSLRRGPDQKEIDGRKNAKQPRDFDQIFSTVDRRRYYFDADRTAVQTIDFLGAGLDIDVDDAIRVARSVVENDVSATLRSDSISVPIAYLRTTRQDGWQAIINLGGVIGTPFPTTSLSSSSSSSSTTTNKSAEIKSNPHAKPTGSSVRRLVTITRGYGSSCETTLVRPREVVRLNVLVPYSSRPNRLATFLNMFADYFEAAQGSSNADLLRIIISTTREEQGNVTKTINAHSSLKEHALVVTSEGDEFGDFSRAVAVREAANKVADDEVIFIADTDLVLGGNFLQNCRVNVVRGSQTWFPVMFSLYPYGKGLSSRDGMWRRSSYGMACMYKSDFKQVGGFGPDEESKFTGWGSEDVFLYNRFRDHEKYAVLRTLEPGLQHLWHGKNCEHNEHYVNCMRTVYMTIGSQDAIAKLMADANVDISNLTKNAIPV